MEGTDAEPEAASPLPLLLEVQERDLELDRIAYRRRESPERHRLADLGVLRRDLAADVARVEADRAVLAKRQGQIDEHVQGLVTRIAQIDARLRSSGAGSFRDQQAMSSERDSLNAQRVATEDDELDVMELLEPVEKEMGRLTGELATLHDQLSEATETLAVADARLDVEMQAATTARAELAEGLPAELAATYERLRAKLGGVGAARLAGGVCSGCHLTLPSRERDQIVHAPAGTVFYCEQCGRILVP